jgi:hypothetical protein
MRACGRVLDHPTVSAAASAGTKFSVADVVLGDAKSDDSKSEWISWSKKVRAVWMYCVMMLTFAHQ